MNALRRKVLVAWVSVASNTFLTVAKISVGLFIGSVSVISEAIHSGVDLLASIIALVAVKGSSTPADEKHPFGHGKLENISGTVEALLIFLAAGWIIYEAVGKFLHPRGIDEPGWGVMIMLLSSIMNAGVSRALFKVGRETDSVALQADAWHLLTDVYTSAGVMVGLALIWLGDRYVPQLGDRLHLIDPLAALIVAALIIKAAWDLTVKSARDLMDANLPEEEAWITELLRSRTPSVHGFHRMRTRKSGATRFVEFHIFVDAGMTVYDAHQLSHDISDSIRERYPGASVTVHVEPCGGACDRNCRSGCLLSEQERQDVQKGAADHHASRTSPPPTG
jgi:cation diffusion facilitator family transporter